MNNILKITLFFFFFFNCSFHDTSKFWTNEKIEKESSKQETEQKVEEIFIKEEALNLEFNPNLKISLYSKAINNSFLNNFDNNNGRINYNGELKNISRFKFKKIDKFYEFKNKLNELKSSTYRSFADKISDSDLPCPSIKPTWRFRLCLLNAVTIRSPIPLNPENVVGSAP